MQEETLLRKLIRKALSEQFSPDDPNYKIISRNPGALEIFNRLDQNKQGIILGASNDILAQLVQKLEDLSNNTDKLYIFLARVRDAKTAGDIIFFANKALKFSPTPIKEAYEKFCK